MPSFISTLRLMLLALIGEDEFAKDCRIAAFWEESLKNGSQRRIFFASDYLREESSLTADVSQALTPSFFDPAASVLVRHCDLLPAEELRNLAGFMGGLSQGNLALDFFKLDKKSVMWKFLEKQKVQEIFDPPKYVNTIQTYVVKLVQEHFKRKIDATAARYIAEAIGSNTKRIYSEIKKIFIYNSDIQEINREHCILFIKPNREVPPYELQDPFGFRNLNDFLPKFRRILAERGAEARVQIVSTLRGHCLTLLHVQAMRAKRIPDYEIQTKILPPAMGFTYQKNRLPEQSQRWQLAGLQKTILELDELSYSIKMGGCSDLPSFELAICKLLM